MTYFNEKILLISNSRGNISLIRRIDNDMVIYPSHNKMANAGQYTISQDIFNEFNLAIDEKDIMYIIYQDMSLNLVLLQIDGDDKNIIKLRENLTGEVYYLNIKIFNGSPNIFYFVGDPDNKDEYSLYHHYLDGESWTRKMVDQIKVGQLLNPMKIFSTKEEIVILYYNKTKNDNLYIRVYDPYKNEWGDKIQLTDDKEHRLYIDAMIKDGLLHICYCQRIEGNFALGYKRFAYKNGRLGNELTKVLSNPENPQHPTLIYYDEKLWISWVEYDNIMSRYSLDMGNSWSDIYMWKEFKNRDIVRYEYGGIALGKNILNHSFGTIDGNIVFVGFGPTDKAIKIPMKTNQPMDEN